MLSDGYKGLVPFQPIGGLPLVKSTIEGLRHKPKVRKELVTVDMDGWRQRGQFHP